MMIEVRAADIRKGIRKVPSQCPIAHACKRAFPGAQVSVGFRTVLFGFGNTRPARLSRSALRFVRAFDAGRKVKPFRFWLAL